LGGGGKKGRKTGGRLNIGEGRELPAGKRTPKKIYREVSSAHYPPGGASVWFCGKREGGGKVGQDGEDARLERDRFVRRVYAGFWRGRALPTARGVEKTRGKKVMHIAGGEEKG